MSVSAASPPVTTPVPVVLTPTWKPSATYDENSPPLQPGDRENPFRNQALQKNVKETSFDVSNIYYQNPKKLEFLADAPKTAPKTKPKPAPRQENNKPPVPEKRESLRATPLRGVTRIPSAKKKFSPKLSRKKEPAKTGIVDLLRNLVADDEKDKPTKLSRDTSKSNIKAFITAGSEGEGERGRAPQTNNRVSARPSKPAPQSAWSNTAPARRLETSFLSTPPEHQEPLKQHQRSQSLSPIARQRATSPPVSLPDTSRILEERLTEIRRDLWGRPTTLPLDGVDSDASARKSIQERTLEYYATAIQRQLQGAPRGRTDTPDYSTASPHSSRSTLVSSPTPSEPHRRMRRPTLDNKKIRQELLDFYYRSIERDAERQRRAVLSGRSGRLSAPPVPYAFAPATPTPTSPVLIPLTHGDFLRQDFLPEQSTYQNLPIRVRPAVPQRTESLPSTPPKPAAVDMNIFVRNSPQRSTIGPISTAKRTQPTIQEETDDVQLRHPEKMTTPKSRPKNMFEAWMSNGRKSKTPPNKTAPSPPSYAPIFKRGSLQQMASPSDGPPALPKRVSFSSSSSPMHATGEWPTRNGSSSQPPSRPSGRLDSCDSDVFLPDGMMPNGCCMQAGHDEAQLYANAAACPDRPLPPIPADARPPPPGLYGINQHQHAQSESESGSEAGEVRRILQQAGPDKNVSYFHFQDEEWGPDGKGRLENAAGGPGRDEDMRRSGGGRGTRSAARDDPRRHTLATEQHPLSGPHSHGMPPTAVGGGGTLSRSMDLESPMARGYPPATSSLLFDDDPGIMSEVETSSTGFHRGGKQRSSLPVVRTPSKTLERPLGLVFLQYRSETKRALLPNEVTSLDTVKALFVRSFSRQLTMEYLDSPHVKIYIHDSSKDMFYELEDLRSHLRDIRDRSVLRLFEATDVHGGVLPGAGTGLVPPPIWEQDQSYFSEPEFDSEYQHQHIHKSKASKSTPAPQPYYMTHSYPPGSSAATASATLPRGGPLLRAYSPAPLPADRMKTLPQTGRGVSPGGVYPAYTASSAPVSYEEGYYGQFSTRSGSITPVIDEEARIRVENMERQLANLTGLVQKALTHGPATPRDFLQVPGARDGYRNDKSVSFEKSVSFSDEPPDMSSPKQHSPQHGADSKPTKPAIKSSTLPRTSSQERDRHKPAPPPKPMSLSPGQYEGRNIYRDLQLTPEMYNQLRGLQKKAKDLRQEVRNLRRLSQAQAHSVRETIRDTFIKIRAMLITGAEGSWAAIGDAEKLRLSREEELYKQEMLRLEKDLTELESTVEELRGNVINRKTRVNMSDVENMALILSKSSKTVADLKVRFPSLQDEMKNYLGAEMDRMIREEKFLKEEPERLDSALRRCKKLTGTLVTLKRLASVQEQRLPGPIGSSSGDSRLSPTMDEEETPPVTPNSASSKVPSRVQEKAK